MSCSNASKQDTLISPPHKKWWKEAVVYQIYPRSFADSNADGIGDIPGIISKLDYLKWLGVDCLWLSPIYKSPNDDNGYDISDYYAIMPEFGTMTDFDTLLSEAHARGIKIVLDLVVNHTSDEHPWFVESRSSKDNPKRDWYIWQPPKNGAEPNNWGSCFTPSAWEFDEHTGEYYLHYFSKKQPDLNWQNPDVRQAIWTMMRWWLDKGIDGFRMDVINWIVKAPGFPDAAVPSGHTGKYVHSGPHMRNQPGTLEMFQEMHREVLSKYDILTVGEMHDINHETGLKYVDKSSKALGMTFQFDIMHSHNNFPRFKTLVNNWYTSFRGKAWNTITLGNHDSPRMVSRFGDEKNYHTDSAKLLATFILTAPGTPFFLQGDEIGMTNVSFPSINHYRDIEMFNHYNMRIAQGQTPQQALNSLRPECRDNARTPMQWSSEKHAGFTSGTPWIPLNPNFTTINVEQAIHDNGSVLNYYRTLIAMRKANPDLVYGHYEPISDEHAHLYIYARVSTAARYIIAMNFCSNEHTFELAGKFADSTPLLLISTNPSVYNTGWPSLRLAPWEGRIYKLS